MAEGRSTVVLDLGAGLSKFGILGQDENPVVAPTLAGKPRGEKCIYVADQVLAVFKIFYCTSVLRTPISSSVDMVKFLNAFLLLIETT